MRNIWKHILCAVLALGAATPAGAAGTGEQQALYGVGSVSKVFTAAAVMRLAEQGALDLDAPLAESLPGFSMADGRFRQITPRMLLNHSSGLQGSFYRNSMLLGDNDAFAHDALLTHLNGQRLKADPGAFSVYCNDGFTLAELLVEQASGMSFTDYLRQNFFGPLGLKHIETPQSSFDRGRLAPIYWNGSAQLPPENANVIGSGGIYATAEDLCRFARIFTRGYDGDLLSAESALEMEQPSYAGGAWKDIPDAGTSTAYGLGWDTVNEYPFGGYGIKAIAKGGDTTAYHASLVVLPEENISCAVISSGGSSGFCSAAVQQILLEYLRETGRIPEDAEAGAVPAAHGETPAEPATGWYASRQQAIYVQDGGDTLTLTSAGTNRDTTQRYRREGAVYRSSDGAYISPEGELVEAQDGTRGDTALSFGRDDEGTLYLLTDTVQIMPGLGETRGSAPFAQRVEANPLPQTIADKWKARADKRYYLVSEKYSSAFYLQNPSTRPRVIDGLPGYVSLNDDGPCAILARVADEDNARFFQTIPGQAGRDLFDLRFYTEDGVEILDTQNYRFIPEEAVLPLAERRDVSIGARGDTMWFSAVTDGTKTIRVDAPENGRFYIYSLEQDGLVYTSGSPTGQDGASVYLPARCRIAFAGDPGAEFAVSYD